jgi:hypothetical protein
MRIARAAIAGIEASSAELVGVERFETAARTLDELCAGSPSPHRAEARQEGRPPAGAAGWAIQDSNLGPLPYQRSALTD